MTENPPSEADFLYEKRGLEMILTERMSVMLDNPDNVFLTELEDMIVSCRSFADITLHIRKVCQNVHCVGILSRAHIAIKYCDGGQELYAIPKNVQPFYNHW